MGMKVYLCIDTIESQFKAYKKVHEESKYQVDGWYCECIKRYIRQEVDVVEETFKIQRRKQNTVLKNVEKQKRH